VYIITCVELDVILTVFNDHCQDKKPMTCGIENSHPGLGQTQKCGGVKPFNAIQPAPLDNWISNENTIILYSIGWYFLPDPLYPYIFQWYCDKLCQGFIDTSVHRYTLSSTENINGSVSLLSYNLCYMSKNRLLPFTEMLANRVLRLIHHDRYMNLTLSMICTFSLWSLHMIISSQATSIILT